ncbi:D-methionine ABC transporter, ATPase subunit [Ferrimonas balearica DSM 9799]|uniref:Cell division ATP-binding protein FtsE n=1 Tax=Ferrimonas balearica (strain DSM 9799 / CCM 4581 / KCTC 23876 / PAT) TaxID=550540 RepID=E1SM73_FERBD|nr:methionine ABC transporter ATP-binding protein MetN [Ferrimonas balearica]ADN76591.1 D-methionine ABC transporter, ATPase subunit [Ferrimonas balearica DSM 9799]MBY6226154.1 methionine ABC transporter ATP-binding protein MetN [Ferrimonas balearica]
MIRLHAVSKSYRQGDRVIPALKPLDLHVPAGTIFGIIGSSGAGKSTLIRCVNLLEQPDAGQIVIDGQDLTQLNAAGLRQARQQIAMIFQHFNLLASRTVYQNVALPLELAGAGKSAIRNKVESLLELVGLSDKADAYPANLSGGQKQRVAIARALANDPKVLLCDEATSALDPETTKSILTLLKTINQKLGLTILLITHEMEVVKQICDRVGIIDQGELIEQGEVGPFFANAKTELARRFIRSTLHLDIPEQYRSALRAEPGDNALPLIRLSFHGDSVDAPVITQAAKRFGIDISILSAQMEYVGGTKFGLMLAELMGDAEAVSGATAYLVEHNIDVEVLGYVH